VRIPLDRQVDVPLFRQVERWLRDSIAAGELPAGTRLPSTRVLADELGVSRITIANAYAELEADGLLLGRPGSGSYVAPGSQAAYSEVDRAHPWPLWQLDLGRPASPPDEASQQEPARPDRISFTGVTDSRHFPIKEFARTVAEVLRSDGASALGYGTFDSGYPPLRSTVAQLLASQGIHVRPQDVMITCGSHQALAIVCQVLLRPGDAVLVEQPTYDLALELFRELDLRIVGVPVDEDGLRVELVEPLLQQHHPKLIYTIPNFQNPTGACLSGSRRRQLLELSDRYNVPLLEDDFAGDLRYDGRAQPAIKALDRTGQVLYIGTFSKLLMPGLRVGYLVANGPILARLVAHKRVHDLTTSPLMQRVLDRYVSVGRYQAHLRRTTRLCRARRDAVIEAVRARLAAAAVLVPRGGLFAWLELPPGMVARELLRFAREEGVDFAPGNRFFAEPSEGDRFVRLNFATRTPQEIGLGIGRLATALERAAAGLGFGEQIATRSWSHVAGFRRRADRP
jgi:GntR family transcriptional regulator / MocR family aminotransferase